jgi:NitT/TauT family transport system substrate-binding protein
MANKVHIQPGAWIVIIGLLMAGAFFGIKTLQKNGTWGKVTSAVVPSGNQGSTKVAKVGGKTPLVVALNTWVGFAPGVYFNGGLESTENSRFMTEYGVPVKFLIMDNFDDSRNAFKADRVQVICNTADVLPTEAPSMVSFDMKVFIQIDWSRGGDAVVVRQGINNVADLKGKTVALAIGTPSQSLIIRLLEAGGIQYSDLIIKKMATAMDAATAFKNGAVDVAIVWSPDDQDCLAAQPGSKVLVSTKQATFAIADIFYAKGAYIAAHQKEIKAFTAGWLKAARELNTDAAARVQAQKLMATCFNVPEAVMNLDNARFTTYGDNVNFFNLMPTQCKCVKGEDLYTKMAVAFNKIGLAPDNVPPWRQITDISILQSLASDFTMAGDAAEEGTTFEAPKTAAEKRELQSKPAIATKRITINFAINSAEVTDDARYIIDRDFSSIAKGFAGSRIRIEGNTDNTGSMETNKALSRRRAQAVANYLASTYNFDANRFVVVGNGQDSPIADNATEEGRAKNRRTDFEIIQ